MYTVYCNHNFKFNVIDFFTLICIKEFLHQFFKNISKLTWSCCYRTRWWHLWRGSLCLSCCCWGCSRTAWLKIALNICSPVTVVHEIIPEKTRGTGVLIRCSMSTLVVFLTVIWMTIETIWISTKFTNICSSCCCCLWRWSCNAWNGTRSATITRGCS